jgi:hypothetical protein
MVSADLDEILNAVTMIFNSALLFGLYKTNKWRNNKRAELFVKASILHMPFSVAYHLTLHDFAYFGDVFMIFVMSIVTSYGIVHKLPISVTAKKIHHVSNGFVACKGMCNIVLTKNAFCRFRHSLHLALSCLPAMFSLFRHCSLIDGLKIYMPLAVGGIMYLFKIPEILFKRQIKIGNSHHLMHIMIGIMAVQTYMFLGESSTNRIVASSEEEPVSHPLEEDSYS